MNVKEAIAIVNIARRMKKIADVFNVDNYLPKYDGEPGTPCSTPEESHGSFTMRCGMIHGAKLWAPSEFWRMTPEQRRDFIADRGCGPGKTGDRFVPDTWWGLPIRPLCSIHDLMYELGSTDWDRWYADTVLLNNGLAYVEANSSGCLMVGLRSYRATSYLLAVRKGGKRAFEGTP